MNGFTFFMHLRKNIIAVMPAAISLSIVRMLTNKTRSPFGTAIASRLNGLATKKKITPIMFIPPAFCKFMNNPVLPERMSLRSAVIGITC